MSCLIDRQAVDLLFSITYFYTLCYWTIKRKNEFGGNARTIVEETPSRMIRTFE